MAKEELTFERWLRQWKLGNADEAGALAAIGAGDGQAVVAGLLYLDALAGAAIRPLVGIVTRPGINDEHGVFAERKIGRHIDRGQRQEHYFKAIGCHAAVGIGSYYPI